MLRQAKQVSSHPELIERSPRERLENQMRMAAPAPDVEEIMRALDDGADPLEPMSTSWSRGFVRCPLPLLAVVDRQFQRTPEVFRRMLESVSAAGQRVIPTVQRRILAMSAKNQSLDIWQACADHGFDMVSRWPRKAHGARSALDLAQSNQWSAAEHLVRGLEAEFDRSTLEESTLQASRTRRLPRL